VGIGPLRTGIFNIADVAIMGGAIILLSYTLHKQKQHR
jgi:lipoprotein signal peptidase